MGLGDRQQGASALHHVTREIGTRTSLACESEGLVYHSLQKHVCTGSSPGPWRLAPGPEAGGQQMGLETQPNAKVTNSRARKSQQGPRPASGMGRPGEGVPCVAAICTSGSRQETGSTWKALPADQGACE